MGCLRVPLSFQGKNSKFMQQAEQQKRKVININFNIPGKISNRVIAIIAFCFLAFAPFYLASILLSFFFSFTSTERILFCLCAIIPVLLLNFVRHWIYYKSKEKFVENRKITFDVEAFDSIHLLLSPLFVVGLEGLIVFFICWIAKFNLTVFLSVMYGLALYSAISSFIHYKLQRKNL